MLIFSKICSNKQSIGTRVLHMKYPTKISDHKEILWLEIDVYVPQLSNLSGTSIILLFSVCNTSKEIIYPGTDLFKSSDP